MHELHPHVQGCGTIPLPYQPHVDGMGDIQGDHHCLPQSLYHSKTEDGVSGCSPPSGGCCSSSPFNWIDEVMEMWPKADRMVNKESEH